MPDFELTRVAAKALERVQRLVVPTDSSDHANERLRRIARDLAVEYDLEVLLYDRSNEHWTATPEPVGPLTIDQIDPERHAVLVSQLREFTDAGVTVRAFLAAIPSITEIIDALQDVDAEGVLLPEHLEHPKFADRVRATHSDIAVLVGHIVRLELQHRPVIFMVPESGPVIVQEYESV